jgi:glycosyltransferase involved in cell wall biosynthesis
MSIMRNTAEFARSVIVPSAAVREVVRAEMAQYGRHDLRVHVEHLPVPREFAVRTEIDPDLPHECYFIVCGAIDSYKNHLFLLEVWQRLAARLGKQTPKLVIAGSPGVSGERVIAYLKEHVALHEHVILASGLATKALRQLMIGAHALLMPSLAEGFGLPIIEALAQGTPVIASDIPAHREAGRRGDVTYLTPTDVESWLGCIEAMAGQPKRSGLPGQPYKPKSWKSYFMGIEAYLSKIQRLSAIQR